MQIALGYLNRPELTAVCFVANPWASGSDGRALVYRTGDRVRWYADGELEFGGRIDFQVKLCGQRIELGEIEQALRAQPGVTDAVVLLHRDKLVAYVSPAMVVSPSSGGDFTAAMPFERVSLFETTRHVLPAYMLPSLVVGVLEWPRTSTGKIDRKLLPKQLSEPREPDAALDEVLGHIEGSPMLEIVLSQLQALLQFRPSPDAPLMEAGLDSLSAVAFTEAMAAQLQRPLPAEIVFDYPTASRLAHFLQSSTDGRPADAAACASLTRPDPEGSIIAAGWAARLPQGVDTEPAVWRMSAAGSSTISKVPPSRWDTAKVRLDEDVERRALYGAFIHGAERFDAGFFTVSPGEVSCMDPQQRLLLEEGYAALHNAGHRRAALEGSSVGVFVGISYTEFATILSLSPQADSVYAATGSSLSVAGGRLSFALGLQGPCATVETACSSSLVALHGSMRALQHAESSAALVTGVTLMLLPTRTVMFAKAGMTSPSGRSHTFDHRADGYARGEACGAVALNRKDVPALVSPGVLVPASAVRQDGKSASLTAPNGQAQQALVMS